MSFLVVLLQTIAGFLMVVMGYVFLLLVFVVCFCVAICLYKGGCINRTQVAHLKTHWFGGKVHERRSI
jgi:hypothetical protein